MTWFPYISSLYDGSCGSVGLGPVSYCYICKERFKSIYISIDILNQRGDLDIGIK